MVPTMSTSSFRCQGDLARQVLLRVTRTFPLANSTGTHSGYNTATFNGTETWVNGDRHTDVDSAVKVTTTTYYTGRAPHVHITVRKDWVQSENIPLFQP